MRVLYIYADNVREWNCSEWNAIIPTKAINKVEGHSAEAIYINDFVANSPEVQQKVSNADIVVVERNYFGDTLTVMQYWKVRGKTVACIFDDAYDIMHPKNISYRFWNFGEVKYNENYVDGSPVINITGSEATVKTKEGTFTTDVKNIKPIEKTASMSPTPLEQFRWGLRIAKAVQVPSVNLQKDWSRYNPNTYYVHNFLDIDKYMNIAPLYPHEKDDIIIGWCGSLSHYASFFDSGLLDALKRVCSKYKNVKVLISGDKRIWDLLDIGERKIFQPFVPKEQWCPLLKTLDIGLAPLAGEYDKRRSWIKAMEYMALKIPWIASNYPTYDELHDYGMMTENGTSAWVESLSKMIEEYPKYKELAETKAYDFALSQSSYEKVKEITLPLYQKIIEMPYD